MSTDRRQNETNEDRLESPRREAVALTYDGHEPAPRVVAKGYGDIADAIIERAREHGLYVHSEPELVRLLTQLDLDSYVPPELYVAVAELLAWTYELEQAAQTATRNRPG
jgi:flagellar biosynthesis protein